MGTPAYMSPEQVAGRAVDMPPSLAAVIEHCLEKSPRDRVQTAREVVDRLRELPGPRRSSAKKFRAL